VRLQVIAKVNMKEILIWSETSCVVAENHRPCRET